MQDKYRIGVRLTSEEKARIKDEATNNCMSLNQYIKYKVLDVEDADRDKNRHVGEGSEGESSASQFLVKNFALFARILISGYMHLRLLGIKHLSKEELEKIGIESEQEFKKLGVSKEEGQKSTVEDRK